MKGSSVAVGLANSKLDLQADHMFTQRTQLHHSLSVIIVKELNHGTLKATSIPGEAHWIKAQPLQSLFVGKVTNSSLYVLTPVVDKEIANRDITQAAV